MKIHSLFSPCTYRLGVSLLLTLSLSSCTESKTKNIPAPIPPVPVTPVSNEEERELNLYTELVWSDEFDGSTLDQTKWTYEVGDNWFNNEKQAYTNASGNVYLNGGSLFIQAKREQSGSKNFSSGRIITKGKKEFQYGRIDIRAKLPKGGKGIWPAIWMLGSDIDQNNWPKCGEIDIMEWRGSRPKEFLTTMHFAKPDGSHDQGGLTKVLPEALSDGFHVYTIVRSKNLIRFFLDGTSYYSFTSGSVGASPYVFNNQFFMILNLAVGGDFDGDPDASVVFPQQMEVDYVKYLQYK